MPRLPRLLAIIVPLLVAVAACGGSGAASPTPLATGAASVAAATVASTPDACAKDSLKTLTAGKLTIGADNPAFPPYYQPASPQPSDSPWEIGDPRTGQGLEAAVAYAVAEKLGFTKDDVAWVATPFNTAIQPGTKPFDYYLTQVSFSPERAQAVDLSDGYFDLNQAVVALKDDAIANVKDVAGLKAFKLGAPVGTTSYTYITDQIKPTQDAASYDTLDAGLAALQAKQIDGLVVDLPTAFYMRDAQLTNGVIVGSLRTVGTVEHFSILLSKGSPLTTCVNRALAALKADGTLKQITDKWITSQGAPELK